MSLRTLFAAATLAAVLATPAHAALEQSGDTLELDLNQVTLPTYVGGRFSVRQCETCEPVYLTVTESTRYHVGFNSERLSLAKFREAVLARGTSNVLLYVTYDFASRSVTRVVMDAVSSGFDSSAESSARRDRPVAIASRKHRSVAR